MMFARDCCLGNVSPTRPIFRDMDVDWNVIGGHQTRNLSSIALAFGKQVNTGVLLLPYPFYN